MVICSTQSCSTLFVGCRDNAPRATQFRSAARSGWAIIITGMETVVPLCPDCRGILADILKTRPDQPL